MIASWSLCCCRDLPRSPARAGAVLPSQHRACIILLVSSAKISRCAFWIHLQGYLQLYMYFQQLVQHITHYEEETGNHKRQSIPKMPTWTQRHRKCLFPQASDLDPVTIIPAFASGNQSPGQLCSVLTNHEEPPSSGGHSLLECPLPG